MPLRRTKPERTAQSKPQATRESGFKHALEKVEGMWSNDGEILCLPGWRAIRYKELADDIIIWAELATKIESACSSCGAPASEYKLWGRTETVSFNDLPIRAKRTRIHCQIQRFRCTSCGKTRQQPTPGLDERHQMTRRLVEYVEKEAFKLPKTFYALADEAGVCTQLIRDMFTARAEHLEKTRRIETPEWLSIDEVYIRKKARCIITDPMRRSVLDMLPDDKRMTLGRWLLQLPNRKRVKIVTMDMCHPYLLAVTRLLPQAVVIVDRFHVHNLLNCAIKHVMQVSRRGMSYSEQREYMRDPHLLLKSRYKLSDKTSADRRGRRKLNEKEVVEKWLEDVPALGTAYRLKEDFSDILQLKDRREAEEKFDLWMERVRQFVQEFECGSRGRAGRKDEVPFSNVLVSIKQWREYILNYIDYKNYFGRRPTNGFAESANRQIKRAQSLGNGYNFEVIRAKAIYGGVVAKRRPRFRLTSLTPRARRGRGRDGQGAVSPGKGGNIIKLEGARKANDETEGLLQDPKSVEGWVERFEEVQQGALYDNLDTPDTQSGSTGRHPVAQGKRRKPRRRQARENSKQEDDQLKMF